MARGEPPNRRRTFPKKNGDNAVIEWMKSYLMGLAGPLGAAADPSANIASQAGSFVPSQQLSAGGRVNPQIARDAINQYSIESYDRASLEAGGGLLAAGMAATAFRRPGAALARGFRAAPSQIAKQRGRSAAAMRAGGADTAAPAPNRPSPQEMVQAAQAQQRMQPPQTRPPAGFPADQQPRTDGLTPNFNVRPRPARPRPQPPAAPEVLDTRVTSESGSVNVSRVIDNGLKRKISRGDNKGKSQGLSKDQVSTTWDGTKEPKANQFKKIDPETGKKVNWYEGYRAAKKSWETVQTKSNPRNPNATPDRVQAAESMMTPDELDQLRRAQFLDENPQVRVELEEAAYKDYVQGGGMDFDKTRRLMQEMPFGNRPTGFKRGKVPPRMKLPARGAEPTKRAGETDAQFQARLAEWQNARTNSTYRLGEKKQSRVAKPKQGYKANGEPMKNPESDAAYQKRVDKWRAATGPQSRAMTVQGERARVDRALREGQPNLMDVEQGRFNPSPFADPQPTPGRPGRQPDGGVSRKAGDPNTYQGPMDFRPSYMQGDMRTYYPSYLYGNLDQLPDARSVAQAASFAANQGGGAAAPAAVNPLNLPRFTPTRGKGSTRLRNVRKAADEAPKSNVADKPKPKAKSKKKSEETPEEVTIPKRSTKPKDTKKQKDSSRAEVPDYASGRTNDRARKKPFGPAKPESQKKDVESPREAGEKPRRVFAMGSKPESTRGVSTPLSDRPKRQAPDGGFAMPGRKAASAKPDDPTSSRTRVGRGYTTAEQEKAIKDRAKTIYAAGDRAEKRKFFATAVGVGGPAAALAGVMTYNKIQDEKVQQVAADGAAEAAEEAVENPKSKEAKAVLRDKYGRKITREEYNRREAFRKKLEGMSPAERKAARKKEMARREKWRASIGKQLFGKMATKASRNVGKKKFAGLDDSARRALRAS